MKAATDVVLSGKIFIGTEAVRLGLADGLGSPSDGLAKAAGLAHVANYAVRDLRVLTSASPSGAYSFFYKTKDGELTAFPNKAGTYFLYIPSDDGRLP